jgi:hypothetical protein
MRPTFWAVTASLLHSTVCSPLFPPPAEEEVRITLHRRQTGNVTAVPPGAPQNNVTTLSIVLTGFEDCNANTGKYGTLPDRNWKTWIIDGFKEQYTMAIGENKFDQGVQTWGYPDVDWTSAPAVEFFGPGYKNSDWRNGIQANLDRHSQLDYAWFFGWRLVSAL